jgi:hypothetical protein
MFWDYGEAGRGKREGRGARVAGHLRFRNPILDEGGDSFLVAFVSENPGETFWLLGSRKALFEEPEERINEEELVLVAGGLIQLIYRARAAQLARPEPGSAPPIQELKEAAEHLLRLVSQMPEEGGSGQG